MNDYQIPSTVFGRVAKTAAPSNASLATALGITSTTPSANINSRIRNTVLVTAYSDAVYLKLANTGTAPSVACSSSDYDYVVAAGTTLPFTMRRSMDMYVTSAGSYSAVEIG